MNYNNLLTSKFIIMEKFIKKFAEQFDETESSVFNPKTVYKELDEWSSLIALSVIAMIDEEYDVAIKGNDIKESETIEDLYNVVMSKKA